MPRSQYYWRVIKENLKIVYYKAQTVDQILNFIDDIDSITDINRLELASSFSEEMYEDQGLIKIPFEH